MTLPPLRFEPILRNRAWGGDRLANWGRVLPAAGGIGESWDLADLPPTIAGGISRIAEGPLRGRTLADLRAERPGELLGRLSPASTGGFPLLVKLLDAEDDLSVQVHPDPSYAAEHPEAFVKNEAWFVLEARPGAAVYRGIKDDVTPELFLEALREGRLLECLVRIEVRPGDCVRLPSGICHALGAGVLVIEAQTPSDTTFRVWDWDRNDPARPLHLEAALECMRFGERQHDGRPAVISLDQATPVSHDGITTRRLCSTDDFTIDHVELADRRLKITTDDEPTVLTGVSGTARVLDAEGRSTRLAAGDTVLIPASCPRPEVRSESSASIPPDQPAPGFSEDPGMKRVSSGHTLRMLCILCGFAFATSSARAVDHRIELDAPWPQAADVAPGDRILLAAGLHSSVMIQSYRGTSEAPVVITSAHPKIPAGIGKGTERDWALELRDCDHVTVKSLLVIAPAQGGVRVVGPESGRRGSVSLVDLQVLPPAADRFPEFGISAARLDRLDLAGLRVYRWIDTGFRIEDTGAVRGSVLVGEGTGKLDSGLVGLASLGVDRTRLTGCSFIGMTKLGVSVSGLAGSSSSLKMDRCVFLKIPTPIEIDAGSHTSLSVDLQRSTIVNPVEGVVVVTEPKSAPIAGKEATADDRDPITVKMSSCLVTWTVGRLKTLVDPGTSSADFEFGPNLWWSAESSELVDAFGGFPGRKTGTQLVDVDPDLETKSLIARNPAAAAFGHGVAEDNPGGPE